MVFRGGEVRAGFVCLRLRRACRVLSGLGAGVSVPDGLTGFCGTAGIGC